MALILVAVDGRWRACMRYQVSVPERGFVALILIRGYCTERRRTAVSVPERGFVALIRRGRIPLLTAIIVDLAFQSPSGDSWL